MQTADALQQAFKYLFPSEVQALKQLALSLPVDPVVINIGAGAGTSGLTFIESRLDLRLITIDVQYEDSPFGCIVAEREAIRNAGYPANRYYYIVGDSKVVGQEWLQFYHYINKADMVFVDGDHSYNGAKGDILAWLPNIKSGGIMAVHDFNKREVFKDGPIEGAPHPLPWPGVDRAVRKFLCGKYEIILQVETLISFRIT